jgi:thymidylate kinase
VKRDLVTIKIEGVAGSGKTMIAWAIEDKLRSYGMDVIVTDDQERLPKERIESALANFGREEWKRRVEIRTVTRNKP